MKQSRATSFWKSVISTSAGIAVAMVANVTVLPLFGFRPSLADNVLITAIYTVISLVRGYAVERLLEAVFGRVRLSPFMGAVIAERVRQVDAEGWSPSHDDQHRDGELALAGACYAMENMALSVPDPHRIGASISIGSRMLWPWGLEWWKPADRRRNLVKAAALILAEGERFDRRRKRRAA